LPRYAVDADRFGDAFLLPQRDFGHAGAADVAAAPMRAVVGPRHDRPAGIENRDDRVWRQRLREACVGGPHLLNSDRSSSRQFSVAPVLATTSSLAFPVKCRALLTSNSGGCGVIGVTTLNLYTRNQS